jgi:hypothetical protein
MKVAVRCCSGFVLEVCHQHGGSFKVEHTITACLYLLQRARIDVDGGLCVLGRCLCSACSFSPFRLKGHSPIFGMDGSVVAEQEIATHEGTLALLALEGTLLGVCTMDVLADASEG